jgi:hypothetical protein
MRPLSSLSSAPLHLFSWHSWFCEALSASCFLFLTEASYAHILRYVNRFFLVLLDACLPASSKQTFSFSVHFSLLHTSVFMFPLASVSFV